MLIAFFLVFLDAKRANQAKRHQHYNEEGMKYNNKDFRNDRNNYKQNFNKNVGEKKEEIGGGKIEDNDIWNQNFEEKRPKVEQKKENDFESFNKNYKNDNFNKWDKYSNAKDRKNKRNKDYTFNKKDPETDNKPGKVEEPKKVSDDKNNGKWVDDGFNEDVKSWINDQDSRTKKDNKKYQQWADNSDNYKDKSKEDSNQNKQWADNPDNYKGESKENNKNNQWMDDSNNYQYRQNKENKKRQQWDDDSNDYQNGVKGENNQNKQWSDDYKDESKGNNQNKQWMDDSDNNKDKQKKGNKRRQQWNDDTNQNYNTLENSDEIKVISVKSDSFSLLNKRKVNITFSSSKEPIDAYCRIDDQIKRGIVINRTTVICMLPNSFLPEQSYISVSLDLKNWSQTEIVDTYPSPLMIGGFVLLVIFLILYIRLYVNSRPTHRPRGLSPQNFLPLSAKQNSNGFAVDTIDSITGFHSKPTFDSFSTPLNHQVSVGYE